MKNEKPTVTFEDIIEREGVLVYTNVGTSMMPLLRQNRDLMVIKKPTGRLKKYDAPLYKRSDGKYILHRVLKVRENDYVICGDNQWRREYGITDSNVVGVLDAVVRNQKMIKVTDPIYRVYVHLWCDLFPLRAMLFWVRDLPSRGKRYAVRKIRKYAIE